MIFPHAHTSLPGSPFRETSVPFQQPRSIPITLYEIKIREDGLPSSVATPRSFGSSSERCSHPVIVIIIITIFISALLDNVLLGQPFRSGIEG